MSDNRHEPPGPPEAPRAPEPPAVIEIIEAMDAMLKADTRAETAFVIPRAHAQALVDYFSDIGSFRGMLPP